MTSAKKEEKARQHVLELSAGTHKSQKKASGAGAGGTVAGGKSRSRRARAVDYTEPRQKPGAVNPYGCKGKPEIQVVRDVLVSSPKKRLREAEEAVMQLSAASEWDQVTICIVPLLIYLTCACLQVLHVIQLQQKCIESFDRSLDAALGKISMLLQERDSMRALLADKYQAGQDATAEKQRLAVIKDLIGDGWDMQAEAHIPIPHCPILIAPILIAPIPHSHCPHSRLKRRNLNTQESKPLRV